MHLLRATIDGTEPLLRTSSRSPHNHNQRLEPILYALQSNAL